MQLNAVPQLAALALALLAPPALPQGVGFQRSDYPEGADARWVDTGDVDGDGLIDLAIALRGDDALGIRLGTGAGAFGNLQSTPAGSAPHSVALGDLTGDGALDALVTHAAAPRLWLLTGSGSGTFAPSVGEAAGQGSRTVRLADFNLDGHLDAAVANMGSRDVRVLLGDGAGAFPSSASYFAGYGIPHIALADTDADGDLDILGGAEAYNFIVLHLVNDGSAVFTTKQHFHSGAPLWVAAGDLTGDGLPDLAAPTEDGVDSLLEVQIAQGGNEFGLLWLLGATEIFMNELGDFDGDGVLDHLARGADVRVYTGTGTGVGYAKEILTAAPLPQHMALADLNGDGALDFVTSNGSGGGVTVMLNRPCGPPVVDAIAPSTVPNATVNTPVHVQVNGCGLSSVTQVLVDGNALLPWHFSAVVDEELTFTMPLVSSIGPVPVELVTDNGSTVFDIYVEPVDPPLVVMDHPLPDYYDPGDPATVTLAGAPGNAYFLFASSVILPTVLPGLLDLDIGLGFMQLSVLSATILGPSGWEQQDYTIPALPPGAVFYLQGAVLETLEASPPLTSSNFVEAGIQP